MIPKSRKKKAIQVRGIINEMLNPKYKEEITKSSSLKSL